MSTGRIFRVQRRVSEAATSALLRCGTALIGSGDFDYWGRLSDRAHAGVRAPFEDEWRGDAQFEFLKSVGLMPSDRFLNYGCANLSTALAVVPYLDAGNYVGIDVGREVCARGVRRLVAQGIDRRYFHILNASSPDLVELEGFCFDFIFSFSVLQYLKPRDFEKTLSRLSRLSAPGCRMCFTFSEADLLPAAARQGMYRYDLDAYRKCLPHFSCEVVELKWPDGRPSQTGQTTSMVIFRT